MTEKRFTCHQMIADYSTGEDIDFDFLPELIDEQEQPKDLRMHISDGNKIITYRECIDLLNELHEENQQLKNKLSKIEKIINNRLNLNVVPTFPDGKTKLGVEERWGYFYALEQLKKKLIRTDLLFQNEKED